MDSLNPNMDYKEYNPFANRKKNEKFNQEQLNYIKELLDLNWTINQICQKFNLSDSAKSNIKLRIKYNNWKASLNRNSSLTNAERQQIQEDIKNNISHEEICQKYGISLESLNRRIANNSWDKAKRKPVYSFNESYFDEINNEHKAYWLGFLLADGYILSLRNRTKNSKEQQSFGFDISIDDMELAQKFKEDLESNHPLHFYKNTGSYSKNAKERVRILLRSQHTVEALKKWGMRENKTFFITMPDISEELIPHLIRGYSDGDGCIGSYEINYANRKKSYFTPTWSLCGTKEFLTEIKKFLGKENLKLYQTAEERGKNNWILSFGGVAQCKILLGIIYKDATIYLQRKYDKYVEIQGMNG